MVVLYPDNPDPEGKEVLVLLRPNDTMEKWTGHKLRKDEATLMSGIKNVQWVDSFSEPLQVMMHHTDIVYLNSNENDRMDTTIFRADLIWVHDFMKRYPLHHYERASRIIKELRAVKTPAEIDQVKKAIDITAKAFNRVLKFVEPSVNEYEIEAEISHEFMRNRATRHAYHPIIASGKNACILHYTENNNECRDGELILLDFGAEYGNYNADLSRTIPVNGKFTERQAQLYNVVLHAHNFAKSLLKPGISIVDYTKQVNKEMEKQILELGLIKQSDIDNQDRLTLLTANIFIMAYRTT